MGKKKRLEHQEFVVIEKLRAYYPMTLLIPLAASEKNDQSPQTVYLFLF